MRTRQADASFLLCHNLVRYDFDRDGYVIQEDVRLILSHIPIDNSVTGHLAKEGIFT